MQQQEWDVEHGHLKMLCRILLLPTRGQCGHFLLLAAAVLPP